MPGYTNDTRFSLDVVHPGLGYICSLPYNNIQGEWKMSSDGGNLRFSVPYRDNAWLTPDMLQPGEHWIMLTDNSMDPANNIRFYGPLWDATASSSEGTLSCGASDIMSVLKKRIVRTVFWADIKYTSTKPENIISDILANRIPGQGSVFFGSSDLTGHVAQNGSIALAKVSIKKDEMPVAFDEIQQLASLGDGVDYFTKWAGSGSSAVPTIELYGGRINPATTKFTLEYGSAPSKGKYPKLDGYALGINAESIINLSFVLGKNGLRSSQVSTFLPTNFAGGYYSEDLTTQAEVDAYATQLVKNTISFNPQVTIKGLDPFIDFTFGDKVHLVIDDYWASYDNTARIVGWQTTIGRHDQVTNVLYLNNLDLVS